VSFGRFSSCVRQALIGWVRVVVAGVVVVVAIE
jgi:hypothetical protein